ncbi:hypothetical protein ANDA3_3077 [plant metagenome]|uniref:DUF4376 domain-containing protein n=1 Tax=plant metagenome TaxID=1297885 RepID=A0A484U0P5_9ZZZZ
MVDAAARFSAAKDAKLRELDAARDDALAAGFSHQGVRYDSDPKSRQRIAALLSVSLADAGFSTPYITADNTVVTLGAVALAGLASAAAQHESTLVFQARALKDQVLVATTVEAIEQIAWSPIQA